MSSRLSALAAFAIMLLTLSACVVEPLGEGRGDHYRHEDGHRVWHE
jgi:hypothetical protein